MSGIGLRKKYKEKTPGSLSKATFHARSPAFQIDHIFVSSHFKVLDAEVKKTIDTRTASNHLSLVDDLAVEYKIV